MGKHQIEDYKLSAVKYALRAWYPILLRVLKLMTEHIDGFDCIGPHSLKYIKPAV